jgi:hypothetical protein
MSKTTFTCDFIAQSNALQEVIAPILEIKKACLPKLDRSSNPIHGEIKIGNVSIPIAIKEVTATFDSRLDEAGYPIAGSVKVAYAVIPQL